MWRPVSLHLVKQDRWVANGRAFQPRWPCDGRGCRRSWAELGWAGLAVSWIFTVRSSLRSVEGCGSNGQGELYLPQNFTFAGSCTLSEYFPSSYILQSAHQNPKTIPWKPPSLDICRSQIRSHEYSTRHLYLVRTGWVVAVSITNQREVWKHGKNWMQNCVREHSRPTDMNIIVKLLSLIHIWRCRRSYACRSRWSPYH